jgi:hypothetical protein
MTVKKSKAYFSIVGMILLGLLILAGSVLIPTPVNPNQRAGFGVSTPNNVPAWTHRLGAGWYINWSIVPSASSSYPEIWQMVRPLAKGGMKPDQQVILSVAHEYPGNVWIIGNEPDNIWQDNLTAEAYARFYHDMVALIKSADPTAILAVGGISQATPIRLRYLDEVLSDYQNDFGLALPADWWTLHGYVLQEKRGSWGVDIPPGFCDQTGVLYSTADHGSVKLFQE